MPITKILLKFDSKKENLLKAIKEINSQEGWVSENSVRMLANHFSMKPAEVFSTASFYDEIKTKKPAEISVQICSSANCNIKKADELIKVAENFFHQKVGDNSNSKVKIEKISCLGRCAQGPNAVINGTVYEKMDAGKMIDVLSRYS